MRSMWKGAISFGLVMIPVKLYAATEQKDIAFRQVHREDGGRIRFRRVCSADGEEVPYEDVAKGYELATGEMVILTDEDMAQLPLPSTRSIEVLHFMPAEQLDPILINRSYYAEPERAGERAYVLLRDSLERSGKVALAMVALRQRESLALLRSRDGVLVLETLLWPDEVRAPDFGFLDSDIEARPQELQMAASLIDSMTTDFEPDAYHDSYREALQELVDAKVEGRELAQPAPQASEEEPASLADALKASLEAARRAPGPAQQAGSMRAADPPASLAGGADRSGLADGGDDEDEAGEQAAGSSGTQRRAAAGTGTGGAGTAGPAKGGTRKTGTAKTGTAKTGTAKTGTAKTGTAKTGTARGGTAKGGTAKGSARSKASKDSPEQEPSPRTRRKAS